MACAWGLGLAGLEGERPEGMRPQGRLGGRSGKV